MKILLISNQPSNGGGVGHWAGVVINYVKENMKDAISLNEIPIHKYKRLKHSFFERFIINGIDLFKIKKKIKRICKIDKPHIIHITATGEWSLIRDLMILKIANKYNVSTVYHIHFGRIPEFKDKNNLNWKYLCKCFNRSSSIWAIDQKTQKTILTSFPNKKIEYMPNPVDVSNEKTNAKCEFNIMYLGWIVKTKGIEELLQAFNRLIFDYPDLKLNLVGPYKEDYINYLKNTYNFSNVVITGKKEHKESMDMMNKCSIFVLPSYTEGFPNVILEAMSLGKPIIASNVGAIPDMLSGDCGIVINSKSIDEIEIACRELLSNNDLKMKLAQNAYNKVRMNYSTEVVMNKYYEKWKEMSDDTI